MKDVVGIISDLADSVSPVVLGAIFVGAVAISMIFTLILNHHWNLYGKENSMIKKGKIIYFAGIYFLLIILGFSVIVFLISR